MSALLAAAVALPAITALGAFGARGRLGDHAGRFGAAGTAAAWALALAVLASVALSGPVELVRTGADGSATAGLVADRLSGLVLVVVLGVSAVVQAFSSRYLSGDPRQWRLVAVAGATTSAVAAMVCAATLSGLVVAWVLTGLGLLALLAHRADLPAARLGLRRAARSFAIGDAALLAAAAIAWTTVGDLDLRQVGAEADRLAAAHVTVAGLRLDAGATMACLLVVAAMGRSALLPLHRWLPATLAAPTPVSAFFHAGLVNAGGFLLVRLAPIFGLSPVATGLAFAAGAATALYGTALMLAKPDVKGALAHSTMGQMGFMVLACALGVPAAAILHLLAHGMYKATLFLGADGAIHGGKRRAVVPRPAPPAAARWPTGGPTAVAALVAALALAFAATTFAAPAVEHDGAIVLLAFAWITATAAGRAWLSAAPRRPARGLAALALACLAYAGLIAGAESFLAPAVAEPTHAVAPWLALLPVLAGGALLAARRRPARWSRVYVRLLDGGHVAARPPRDGRRRDRRATTSVPALELPRSVTA